MLDRSKPFVHSGRGMSADYKSVFRLATSRTVLEKWAKKSESREIWANFDPPAIFLGGAPQVLKPVLGTSFQGLLPGKFWTTSHDHKRLGKNFAPPKIFFWGEGPPRIHKLDIMTNYHLQKCEVSVTLDPRARPV